MKFSAQEEFGLRCLLQIARQESMTIPQISSAEGMSEANAGKILRVLRLAGFVDSSRGQEGGYHLSRPANQILISDVLNALGGKLFDEEFCEKHAGDEGNCSHLTDCSLRHLWRTVQTSVDQALSKITLSDLAGSESAMMIQIPKTISLRN